MNVANRERGKRFILVWRGAIQRFTPQGTLLTGAYLATLPFIEDVRSSLVYQLFGLSLALLGFSLLWVFTVRIRGRGFSLRRSLPAFVTAGEPFSYECRLSNHTLRDQRDVCLLERVDDLAARMSRPTVDEPFRPGREARLRIQGLVPRRGVLRFSGARIAIPDPLGLFRSFHHLSARDSLHVFPRRYPVPDLRLMGRTAAPQADEARQLPTKESGDSQEFAYVREYRHGDPIRRIHWKGWPRYGGPVVKEFHDEQRGRYALFLDCSTPPPDRGPLARASRWERARLRNEIFETAISAAASWAAANWPDDTPLDLLAMGRTRITPQYVTGPARTLVFLQELAAAGQCPDQEFDAFRELVLGQCASFTGAILILPAPDARRLALVEELQRTHLDVKPFAVTWDDDHRDYPPCRTIRPASIAGDLAWA